VIGHGGDAQPGLTVLGWETKHYGVSEDLFQPRLLTTGRDGAVPRSFSGVRGEARAFYGCGALRSVVLRASRRPDSWQLLQSRVE
jgi:hypothetical protein